jgi:hypothetical protein
MLAEYVAGYLVVRMPSYNSDLKMRGVFRQELSQINGVRYSGLDRMPWFDIDEDFYQNALPKNIKVLREHLKVANADLTGINTAADYATALDLLDYSNRNCIRNEIIAVRSTVLNEVKGTHAVETNISIEWLGIDVVNIGFWSLLSEGVFVAPDSFSTTCRMLNRNGLLHNALGLPSVVESYSIAAARGEVEQLPAPVYKIDAIEVGRVFESAK